MKKGFRLLVLTFVLILTTVSLAACGRAERFYFHDVFGTFLEIDAEGTGRKDFADSLYDSLKKDEAVISADIAGSDVERINSASVGESVECSPVTMELLAVCEKVYRATDGAYDPSVYPLVKLWGFAAGDFVAGGNYTPPSQAQIDSALALVGFDRVFAVDYDNNTVTKLVEGAALDLGGVAKGWEVQRALNEGGDRKFLINFGGNIGANAKEYTVGISSPRTEMSTLSYIGTFSLMSGETVTTSGDYERYFEYEGKRYFHIIDPESGYPADGGLMSATVVTLGGATDGATADALATAMMIVGKDAALALAEEFGVGCILVGTDKTVTVGLGDRAYTSKLQ